MDGFCTFAVIRASHFECSQKAPEEYQERFVSWLQFNNQNCQPGLRPKIELQLTIYNRIQNIRQYFQQIICNTNQTALLSEYLNGQTNVMGGDKPVWAKAKQNNEHKKQAKIMLAVFADWICQIPPHFIFKGIENSKWQRSIIETKARNIIFM